MTVHSGVSYSKGLTPREEKAINLSWSGDCLKQARTNGDGYGLAQALRHNLTIWKSIRDAVVETESWLPKDLRDNMATLAGYVIRQTRSIQGEISGSALESLINVNYQIARGLMPTGTSSNHPAGPKEHLMEHEPERFYC